MNMRRWMTAATTAGLALVATASQATPIPFVTTVTEGVPQPLRSVQYYSYGDDGYGPPPGYGPAYRGYRQPPANGYYDRPAHGHYGHRDYLRDQKEIVKDQRRYQKEIVKEQKRYQKEVFKEQQRYWNRTHGFR